MAEKRIFLVSINVVTIHGSVQGASSHTERLIEASSPKAAVQHCVSVQRASAADVARLMAAGCKVEDAQES